MNRQGGLALAALAIALSGCATRGPIRLACPIFDTAVIALPPSPLEQDIQADAPPLPGTDEKYVSHSLQAAAPDPLVEAFRNAEQERVAAQAARRKSAQENGGALREQSAANGGAEEPVRALLLSGGGQWGAFGAGFLRQLQASPRAIDPQIITGVSTGGLQSLFVAAGAPRDYDALVTAYAPARQSDIVTTNAKELALITGSMAGIKPLQRRIEKALCNDGDPARGCPMIEAIAASKRRALIGFVEADSGRFLMADTHRMARHAYPEDGTKASTQAIREARDCITGAALASAGMPLFFQPVMIGKKVYYDGGVRQSVFLANVADAARKSMITADGHKVPPPTLYVIRNGPTQLLGEDGTPGKDPRVNSDFTALPAAFRAQSIIVNQVEIGSIAALRLYHPQGEINLATADGFNVWNDGDGKPPGCAKGKERFFNPSFMACLTRFGSARASRPESPWIPLRALPASAKP